MIKRQERWQLCVKSNYVFGIKAIPVSVCSDWAFPKDQRAWSPKNFPGATPPDPLVLVPRSWFFLRPPLCFCRIPLVYSRDCQNDPQIGLKSRLYPAGLEAVWFTILLSSVHEPSRSFSLMLYLMYKYIKLSSNNFLWCISRVRLIILASRLYGTIIL